ncbi:MAG: hypothetical protein IJ740_14075, partial [Ruminococcus sp.]|nr:hypothetical protein [Ruminococcus sp.]
NGGVSYREDDSASGEGYIDISDNPSFKLTVDIPVSQYYKLTVRHKAGYHKENPLLFNGSKVIERQNGYKSVFKYLP